jgi:hypothetical protein
MFYVSGPGSTFAFHFEDMYLWSVRFMHTGAGKKVWTGKICISVNYYLVHNFKQIS